MPPSTKRAGGASAISTSGHAALNAALVCGAIAFGFWLLVSNKQVSWPPSRLFANLYTIAGCLALVGPILLARRELDGGLGDLVWLTGGMLLWIANVAALLRGQVQLAGWATPLGYQPLGGAILAVIIAGWRVHGLGRSWSWTNVVGWTLGLFWLGMGLASLWPGAAVALRPN